ncbi:efflux RND transporter periplasmic adaptor subunit [Aestuariibacter sp. AA17]|uniref:Efflux RND transporter periplasmic adaptor subunit n=1 Tax=Fluctibacter corallii TaxID=2984329 RepID=A0ABT3A5V4_9ALTE|nr:efflux RND transporter periplasmic adaptor subunit [Aestuariibacter sp. AA17]MCV2883944.1 efflux RND transporter periplasmic adaptor subunit [Aestuariibacter sp. AA17]
MSNALKRGGIPLLIVAIAAVIAAVMISSKAPPEKKDVEEKAFLVQATPVEKQDLTYTVNSQGTVKPKVATTLSTQVGGKVVEVSDTFIEGGMFRKGDVLVQLEQSDYTTDLKAAEAELARAKAALEEEQARGKVAEEEWRSVKSSPAPELGLRKPQLAKEMANVRAAEAQLERAKRNLERTTIRAPYDGLVKSKLVDLGQFVTAGSQLGSIFGTELAEVRLPLTDKDLAYLDLNLVNNNQTEVTLTTRVAGRDAAWTAKLARSEGVLDEQRRVLYVVATVEDPYLRKAGAEGNVLNFGRFVQASIGGNKGTDVVVLPREVVRLDGTVLVVTDNREIELRNVTIQRSDEKYHYIVSGLDSGELVTTSAIPNPYNGMVVRLPEDDAEQNESTDEATETELAVSGER